QTGAGFPVARLHAPVLSPDRRRLPGSCVKKFACVLSTAPVSFVVRTYIFRDDTNLHVFSPWYAYTSKPTSCWLHGARAPRRGAYLCTTSFGDSGAQAGLFPSPAMAMPMRISCDCLGYSR
ncbi:unnamed protein product, partial [Ectocarpus sp. 12 AP-2014]